MRNRIARRNERGATLVEFAIGAGVFFTLIFGVLEFSRLLFTHNALVDAARRGARYAVINASSAEANVKNVVIYGVPTLSGGEKAVAPGLTTDNVTVSYSPNFGVKLGTATVSITGYQFQFSVPLIGGTLTMPAYKTTLTGESAGLVP